MSLKQKYDYVVIRNNQSIGLSRCAYEYVLQLEQKQKEFIKYLEEPIKIITDGNPTNISEYTMGKLDTLKEILSKYKEIIGGEND